MKKGAIVSSLVLASCLAVTLPAASAEAAGSSAPTVVNQTTCQVAGPDLICATIRSESNLVQTPSGKTIVEGNSSFVITVTGPDGPTTDQQTAHFQDVFAANQAVETHDRQTETFTSATGQACTLTLTRHETAGAVQFEDANFSCV